MAKRVVMDREALWKHREGHTKQNSWWLVDTYGIHLCRVCDECFDTACSTYKPEVLGISGRYEDVVEEQIEEDV